MSVKEITDADFKQVVENNDLVLVDCWAPWCGPCRMIAPVIEELSNEWGDKVYVAKLNTDDNQKVPMQYNIRAIPTLLIFKNGKLVEHIVGAVPKGEIQGKVAKHIS